VQLQLVQLRDIHIFRHWVFCLFCRSDLSYSWSGSCQSVMVAFAWCSLMYFYAEQIILVKFFHNTAELSKCINLFDCTEHVMTCMLITHLSFSERVHSKKIRFWIKKIRVVRQRRSNNSGFSHAGYSTARQTSHFLSSKRVGNETQNTWHSKI